MAPNLPTSRDNSRFANFGPAVKFPTQYCTAEPLDFRSSAFRDAAHALVQSTGCTLLLCRQALFMAEGAAEDAHVVLLAYRSSTGHIALLH